MEIFGKEIKVKTWDCSFDENNYDKRNPVFNLYIQSEERCNAQCDFCNYGTINNDFDYEKLDIIVRELIRKNLIKRISITGGEPLLDIDKTLKIIQILHKYNIRIALNTNGYSLEKIEMIYPYVDEIFISKHHYDNLINNSIMKINTPTIGELARIDKDNKICINCVLQKNYIDSYEKIIKFLEILGKTNINKIKFISPYPLTKKAIEKDIDTHSIILRCLEFTNAGILYNKNICKCLEFLYVCKTGKAIIVNVKHNKTNQMDCCQQLVFNGKYLFDGFEKRNIII